MATRGRPPKPPAAPAKKTGKKLTVKTKTPALKTVLLGQREAKAAGRTPTYLPEHDKVAFRLTLLGLTLKELAVHFEVSQTTLERWMAKYPSFRGSIKDGGEDADAQVMDALYQRAKGYAHAQVELKVVSRAGINAGSEVERHQTIKQYAPSEAAASIWLRNRQRSRFIDRAPEDTGQVDPRSFADALRQQLRAAEPETQDPGFQDGVE